MSGHYPYEKLGLLYLGRELDLDSGDSSERLLLVKNKDLTTHGVIIGMTGSGKTGLGIGLIEEAIIDGLPSIIIDPKGDMGNLLLSFPECRPEDFLPWIDPAEAARREQSMEQFAEQTATTWREGLASWDQSTERIATLRAKTEMTIYTPGSTAGMPISVLSSFAAPAEEVRSDADTLNSLVTSTVTSLLALVKISGDPLQSREHILLSSLLLHFWRNGLGLSMEELIGHIVNPPFAKVGVFPLNTFYPQPQRMELAMNLNNILASPTFAAWTQGEPLDIQRILYTAEGKPRTAIFSIAHLSEAERMFFVTMLLNGVIGWMRHQQGTSSLKALLYMDEIFGYFPPIANPPSKKPMLLLLKQARAYGVGVVLATQNPVDLDYKGLANIGSWFVGRLQTSQDQERVVDGIVGASDGTLEAGAVKRLIANLKGRQFLLNSVHLNGPVLFETRWVMSYLKGPISQNDIKKLMAGKTVGGQQVAEAPLLPAAAISAPAGSAGLPPLLPEGIEQRYRLQNVVSDDICFEPWLAATAAVRYVNAKRNIEVVDRVNLRHYLGEDFDRADWAAAETGECPLDECGTAAPAGSSFYPLPPAFSRLKDLRGLQKEFTDYLYQNRQLELYRLSTSDFASRPGESLGDFKVRVNDYLREQKDAAVDKLKKSYQLKEDRLAKQLTRAVTRLEKEQDDVRTKTTDSLISFGVAVMGAFLGRGKLTSAGNVGKAATSMRSVGRVAKEKGDVQRAAAEVDRVELAIEELSREMEEQVNQLGATFSIDGQEIETFTVKPRRSDIFEVRLALLWEMVS